MKTIIKKIIWFIQGKCIKDGGELEEWSTVKLVCSTCGASYPESEAIIT